MTTIIQNGRIIDPATNRDEVADLYVVDGQIIASKSESDANGKLKRSTRMG